MKRAERISEPESLQEELDRVKMALEQNGYSWGLVKKALVPGKDGVPPIQEQRGHRTKVSLPYIQGVIDRISKILRQVDIESLSQQKRFSNICVILAKLTCKTLRFNN